MLSMEPGWGDPGQKPYSIWSMARRLLLLQNSTVQYSTVQYRTVQYSTVQNSTEAVLYLVDGEAAAAAAGGGQAEAGQRGEGGEQLHGAGETAGSAPVL